MRQAFPNGEMMKDNRSDRSTRRCRFLINHQFASFPESCPSFDHHHDAHRPFSESFSSEALTRDAYSDRPADSHCGASDAP